MWNILTLPMEKKVKRYSAQKKKKKREQKWLFSFSKEGLIGRGGEGEDTFLG